MAVLSDHRLISQFLDAHAAGGVKAQQLVEQALLRRVMHVNRMRVREVDFHRPHGVDAPGLLTEAVIDRFICRPVHRSGVDHFIFGIE